MASQPNRGIGDEKRLELRQKRKRKFDEVDREPEAKPDEELPPSEPATKRPCNPQPRYVRKQYLINVPTTMRRDEGWEGEKKMLAWREAMEFAAENDGRNPDSDIDEDDGWTAKPGKIWDDDEDENAGIEVHTTTIVYGRIDYNHRNGQVVIDLLGEDGDWDVNILAENVDEVEQEGEQGNVAGHDMDVDLDVGMTS